MQPRASASGRQGPRSWPWWPCRATGRPAAAGWPIRPGGRGARRRRGARGGGPRAAGAAGRHPAQLQDRPRRAGAAGRLAGWPEPCGSWSPERLGCWAATVARRLAERGDQVVVLQRRPSWLGARGAAGRRARSGGARRPRSRAWTPSCTWRPRSTWSAPGPTTWRSTWRAPVPSSRRPARRGAARSSRCRRPSVAHAGRSLVGAGAGPADPASARGPYSRSKAMAEQIALAAHGPAMAVVAVRPHLVWGPGDTQLVERIVERGRAGRLALVGSGSALIDTTYVDNAAEALVAALDRAPDVGGEAFVVSNGEPRPVAEILGAICAAAGVPGPRVRVPFPVAVVGRRRRRCGVGPARTRGRPAAHPVPGRAAGAPRTGSTSAAPARPCGGRRRCRSTRASPGSPPRTRADAASRGP